MALTFVVLIKWLPPFADFIGEDQVRLHVLIGRAQFHLPIFSTEIHCENRLAMTHLEKRS